MRQLGSILLLTSCLSALACSHHRANDPKSQTAALTSAVASLEKSVNQLQLQVHQLSEGVAALKHSSSATNRGANIPKQPPASSGAQNPTARNVLPRAPSAPVFCGRCQAITLKGTQCKRNASPGSYYCWQHPRCVVVAPASASSRVVYRDAYGRVVYSNAE